MRSAKYTWLLLALPICWIALSAAPALADQTYYGDSVNISTSYNIAFDVAGSVIPASTTAVSIMHTNDGNFFSATIAYGLSSGSAGSGCGGSLLDSSPITLLSTSTAIVGGNEVDTTNFAAGSVPAFSDSCISLYFSTNSPTPLIYGSNAYVTGYYASHFGGTTAFSPYMTWGSATPPPPSPSVAFYFPTGATTTPDFPQWLLTLSNVTTTDQYRVDVIYETFGGQTSYDDFNIVVPTYPTAIVEKTQPLTSAFSSSTAWVATAYLMATTTDTFALPEMDSADVLASSTITFTVNPTAPAATSSYPSTGGGTTSSTIENPLTACGTPPLPFFQTTSSLPYFIINDPIPSIVYGGCAAGTFLFIPNSSEMGEVEARLNAAGVLLSTKPPVGYFSQAITALGSFSASEDSTTTILDATSSAAIYGVYEPLDAGVASVIGLMLLAWYFNRGRHLDL